jgi:hypothetical protein
MPRKTRLDNNRNRRRDDERLCGICDIEDVDIAMKPVLTEDAEKKLAAALYEVVANPEKYKHLQEQG